MSFSAWPMLQHSLGVVGQNTPPCLFGLAAGRQAAQRYVLTSQSNNNKLQQMEEHIKEQESLIQELEEYRETQEEQERHTLDCIACLVPCPLPCERHTLPRDPSRFNLHPLVGTLHAPPS